MDDSDPSSYKYGNSVTYSGGKYTLSNTSTGFEVKEESNEHEETLMEKIGGE